MAATFLFEKDGWEYYCDRIGSGTSGGYITQQHQTNGYSYGAVDIYFRRQISINADTNVATIDYFVGYSVPTIMNNRSWSVTAVGLDENITYSSQKVSGTGNTSINPGFVYEFWQDPDNPSNVYTPYMLQSRHIVTAPVTTAGTAKVSLRPSFYYEYPYIQNNGTRETKYTTYSTYYTDNISGLQTGTPPAITGVTFTEQNTALSNYLGDGVFLKNASQVKYNVSYTIDSRVELWYVRVTCGDQVIEGATGVIDCPTTSTIKVQVVDTNKQSVTKSYSISLKDYIVPTVTATCTEPTALGEATLTIEGECYNDGNTNSWGSLNNALVVRYAIRQKGQSEWTWFTNAKLKSRPLNSHKYKYEADIVDLVYTEIYECKAELADSIMTIESPIILIRVIPVYDWSKDDFNINVPTTIEGMAYGKNVLLVDDEHIVLNPYDAYKGDWVEFETPLSQLPHGINVVFGHTEDDGTEMLQSFFVPKHMGQLDQEKGTLMQFTMHDREGRFQVRGYNIYDNKIEASYIFPTLPMASDSMLVDGIDYFEIRYIIGV
jgi:hypothetical protein